MAIFGPNVYIPLLQMVGRKVLSSNEYLKRAMMHATAKASISSEVIDS